LSAPVSGASRTSKSPNSSGVVPHNDLDGLIFTQ